MGKRLIPALCASLSLLSISAHADNRMWHVGWMLGEVSPEVHDPNGPTQSKTLTQWKDAMFLYDYTRDWRLLSMYSAFDFNLDASAANIGQHVERTAVIATLQRDLRVSRSFAPWVGVGLAYASETNKPRYLVTPTGYLAQQFPDRSEAGVTAVVNASLQWPAFLDSRAGLHVQYEHGFNGLMRVVSASLFISY